MAVLFVSVVGSIFLDLYVLQDLLLQLTADITLSETVKASTVAMNCYLVLSNRTHYSTLPKMPRSEHRSDRTPDRN